MISRSILTLGTFVLAACEAAVPVGQPGSPAPDYAALSLSGDTVALANLRGQVVLLNVWATWCGPCVREMPALQRVQDAYADQGLEVVGVSIDGKSSREGIERFLDRHGITFRILHDPAQMVSTTFRTVGVPETFLIGRDGVIAERYIGEFDPNLDAVRIRIEELLAQRGT
jgi:peroxiredoxin